MKYKGYTGIYGFEDGSYHGRVTGLHDVITFEADNEENVEKEFRESVDDYLELCASRGEVPNTPES